MLLILYLWMQRDLAQNLLGKSVFVLGGVFGIAAMIVASVALINRWSELSVRERWTLVGLFLLV